MEQHSNTGWRTVREVLACGEVLDPWRMIQMLSAARHFPKVEPYLQLSVPGADTRGQRAQSSKFGGLTVIDQIGQLFGNGSASDVAGFLHLAVFGYQILLQTARTGVAHFISCENRTSVQFNRRLPNEPFKTFQLNANEANGGNQRTAQ
jgi:hypothetical protein